MRTAPSMAEVFQSIDKTDLLKDAPHQTVTITKHYRLITPLFGGGVVAGVPDTTKAINEMTVRGHLRFWWRATRGADEHVKEMLTTINGLDPGAKEPTSLLQDLEANEAYKKLSPPKKQLKRLYTLESWMFGCAANDLQLKRHPHKRLGASRVEITVKIDSSDSANLEKPFYIDRNGQPKKVKHSWPSFAPPYSVFPLRPEVNDHDEIVKPLLTGKIAFDLVCTAPEFLKLEIDASLWTWATFGGVGARTRRGFGALQDLDHEETSIGDLKKGLEQVSESENWTEGVPHLTRVLGDVGWNKNGNKYKLCCRSENVFGSWMQVTEKLQEFRQGQRNPPQGGGRIPGRTWWPEPDYIGELLPGNRSSRHQNRITFVQKFPRGQFGLPIGFELRNEPVDRKDFRTELSGDRTQREKIDRYASRLIMRPLITNKGVFALVAILTGPKAPPGGYWIYHDQSKHEVKVELTSDDLSTLKKHKLQVLETEPDVLQAFVNWLKP